MTKIRDPLPSIRGAFLVVVVASCCVGSASAVTTLTTATGRRCECTCEPTVVSGEPSVTVPQLSDVSGFVEGSMRAPADVVAAVHPHASALAGDARSRVTKISYAARRRHHKTTYSTASSSRPGMSSDRPGGFGPQGVDSDSDEPNAPRDKPLRGRGEEDANVDQDEGTPIPKSASSGSRPFDGAGNRQPDRDAEWLHSDPKGLLVGHPTSTGFRAYAELPSSTLLKQIEESGFLPRQHHNQHHQGSKTLVRTQVHQRHTDDGGGKSNAARHPGLCHMRHGRFEDYPCKMYCELKNLGTGQCALGGVCECAR